MKPEDVKRLITENAFGFLGHALANIADKPNISVISFYSAIELFLKARLIDEHWALIFSPRQEPAWDRLLSGNFQSVDIETSIDRLSKVVRSPLSSRQKQVIKSLRNHRNKMVHFYHEAQSEGESEETLRGIVKELLVAWYLLQELLREEWRDSFVDFSESLKDIDEKFRRLSEYLQVVYEEVKEEIEEKIENGCVFESCPSCGFDSLNVTGDVGIPYASQCGVCEFSKKRLLISCVDCEAVMPFQDEGWGSCGACSKEYSPSDLASEMIDEGEAHFAIKDSGEYPFPANCGDCDGFQTVVPLVDGSFFCASCFSEFQRLEQCEWCGELNTGDMEGSGWSGCSNCDGRAGWG